MNELQRLYVRYQKSGPFLYGHIHVVRGNVDNQEASYPFIVSKHIQNREIVYGSMIALMNKIAGLKFRFDERQRAIGQSLPEDVKSSVRTVVENDKVVHELPESEQLDWVLQEQEERLEETIMLMLLNLRTLLDILSGKGDRKIDVYDYEDKLAGETSLREIANLLMHHRYFVVRGEYLHDLFSGDAQLTSQQRFGAKIRATELFDEIFNCLSGIRVRDFVGVLRSQLERLTIDSEMKDIVFLIQNIHSLWYIMQERFTDSRFSEVMDLLFREVQKRHIDSKKKRRGTKAGNYSFRFPFTTPRFKIDDDLSAKRIVMQLTVSGRNEEFKFGYEEFFKVLTKVYGDDPLLSLDQLWTGMRRFPNIPERTENGTGLLRP